MRWDDTSHPIFDTQVERMVVGRAHVENYRACHSGQFRASVSVSNRSGNRADGILYIPSESFDRYEDLPANLFARATG